MPHGMTCERGSVMSFSMDGSSIRAQIEELDLGETYARARRFDGNIDKDTPIEAQRSMRLNLQATVHRLEKRLGNKYTIEVGEFRTYSRDVMIVVTVTRTE